MIGSWTPAVQRHRTTPMRRASAIPSTSSLAKQTARAAVRP
jgi:hypothetical protein